MNTSPLHTSPPLTQCCAAIAGTCALLLSLPVTLHAVTETWDGGGANNNLSTGNNWADIRAGE